MAGRREQQVIAAKRRDGPAFLAQGDKSTLAPRCCIEERFARIGPIDVEIGHAVRIGHIVEAIEFERRLALDMDDEIVALAHHLEILGTLAGLRVNHLIARAALDLDGLAPLAQSGAGNSAIGRLRDKNERHDGLPFQFSTPAAGRGSMGWILACPAGV